MPATLQPIQYKEALSILKSIRNELKKLIGRDKLNRGDPTIDHMLFLLRDNQVTEQRYCRPEHHYKYFAETYLTYLRSTRLQEELTKKYFHRGERSVEESAKLVGLKLPQQPQQ